MLWQVSWLFRIFNSPSHGALGTTVTFYIEDTILYSTESELQLRGSFRVISPMAEFTKFPFHPDALCASGHQN